MVGGLLHAITLETMNVDLREQCELYETQTQERHMEVFVCKI